MYEDDGLLMAGKYFVTGIGTEVGKTMVSAVLCEALEADYWKPVQAGDPDHTDSMKIAELISNKKTIIHPERYKPSEPMSPHAAAQLDKVRISPRDFELPKTENKLIVEGAGGVMVPLNDYYHMASLMDDLHLPVILVSRNYLGSINHTLLSVEVLRYMDIQIAGIIFNGERNHTTESHIEEYTGLQILARIPQVDQWDKKTVADLAKRVREEFPA